jgi:hypothetical protein
MTVEEFDRNHDHQIQRDEMTEGFAFIQRPELPKGNPGYGLPIRDMGMLLRIFDHDKEGGIGIIGVRQQHPQVGVNGVPKDRTVLSRNVIGHGSATSAILRVDLNDDLVISQSRRRGGAKYDECLTKFLLALEAGLE